jgi:hypothetical protein
MTTGKTTLGPLGLNPAATKENLSRRQISAGIGDDTDEFLDRIDRIEIQLKLAFTHSKQMQMTVGKTWIQMGPFKIDHADAPVDVGEKLILGPDAVDATVFDTDRFGRFASLDTRVNNPSYKHGVRTTGLTAPTCA